MKKRNDEQCANCESKKVKYFCYDCGDRFCANCGEYGGGPIQCPSPIHEAPELEAIK